MKILAIETSCDETALSLIEATGGFRAPQFKVLGSTLISQIEMHKEYGGVFPTIAKREHSKNIIPLFQTILKKTKLENLKKKLTPFTIKEEKLLGKMLAHEPELLAGVLSYLPTINKAKIDAIAVTQGPGLEPALWVGVNFAKVLGHLWGIPVIPTNHMEGHIMASLLQKGSFGRKSKLKPLAFPALALLISGGHTQLVLIKDWLKYQLIGETRDDAVGEAFDKVARMLSLPYPGGPEISKLAGDARKENLEKKMIFPRPMIKSQDLDFSFSGLKTSVLYTINKIPELTLDIKKDIAREFEDAVTEVLLSKTLRAIEKYNIKTLILGGGVTANKHIRSSFTKKLKTLPQTTLHFPEVSLSTDNAVMIGIASYFSYLKKQKTNKSFKANGNLAL